MPYIDMKPFEGLTVRQSVKALEMVRRHFGEDLEKRHAFITCKDCNSTVIKYRAIVECEMTVNIADSVIDMSDEKVSIVSPEFCSTCGSKNLIILDPRSGGTDDLDGKADEKENQRLVPRRL